VSREGFDAPKARARARKREGTAFQTSASTEGTSATLHKISSLSANGGREKRQSSKIKFSSVFKKRGIRRRAKRDEPERESARATLKKIISPAANGGRRENAKRKEPTGKCICQVGSCVSQMIFSGYKNGGERVRAQPLPISPQNRCIFEIPYSNLARYGTTPCVLRHRKNGEVLGHFPTLMGKKWGRFFECISAISRQVRHRDKLSNLLTADNILPNGMIANKVFPNIIKYGEIKHFSQSARIFTCILRKSTYIVY